MDKVFVIGFQKTGTMTMNGVLTQLGYQVSMKMCGGKQTRI